MMSTTRDVLLDCLHVTHNVTQHVYLGSSLTCETCHVSGEVVSIIEPTWEWVVECLQCTYVRYCGQAPALGHVYSAKHRATRGHAMRIRKTTDPYEHDVPAQPMLEA